MCFNRYSNMSSPAEPATSQTVEASPFNLSALDNDGISFLGRSLLIGDGFTREHYEDEPGDDLKRQGVIKKFAAAIGQLIDVEPDRAKAILKAEALNGDEYGDKFASACLDPLARRDFALARDMYAYLDQRCDASNWALEDISQWATPEQ